MTRDFYKPEPKKPEDSQIAKALRWSLGISVTGLIFYGPFAFAFQDLGIVPSGVQSFLVLLGSALIVIGGESNTVPTLIAALSKLGTKRFSAYDATAVLASLVGSLCNVLITFSARQVKLAGTPWREFAIVKGPLVLGFAAVLDMYGAAMERALIKRDYEMDWATWWEEKLSWDDKYGVLTFPSAPEPKELVFDDSWPQADPNEFQKWAAGLNGAKEGLTEKDVTRWAHAQQVLNPSLSTRKRWVRAARKV